MLTILDINRSVYIDAGKPVIFLTLHEIDLLSQNRNQFFHDLYEYMMDKGFLSLRQFQCFEIYYVRDCHDGFNRYPNKVISLNGSFFCTSHLLGTVPTIRGYLCLSSLKRDNDNFWNHYLIHVTDEEWRKHPDLLRFIAVIHDQLILVSDEHLSQFWPNYRVWLEGKEFLTFTGKPDIYHYINQINICSIEKFDESYLRFYQSDAQCWTKKRVIKRLTLQNWQKRREVALDNQYSVWL